MHDEVFLAPTALFLSFRRSLDTPAPARSMREPCEPFRIQLCFLQPDWPDPLMEARLPRGCRPCRPGTALLYVPPHARAGVAWLYQAEGGRLPAHAITRRICPACCSSPVFSNWWAARLHAKMDVIRRRAARCDDAPRGRSGCTQSAPRAVPPWRFWRRSTNKRRGGDRPAGGAAVRADLLPKCLVICQHRRWSGCQPCRPGSSTEGAGPGPSPGRGVTPPCAKPLHVMLRLDAELAPTAQRLLLPRPANAAQPGHRA